LQLEHFGGGVWGTTGSPKFWNWLRACEAAVADALILEGIDAEARRYRVDLDAASTGTISRPSNSRKMPWNYSVATAGRGMCAS